MVKFINIPLDGLPSMNIHQILVKLHGNNLVYIMDILFVAMDFINIMYLYIKLTGLCC